MTRTYNIYCDESAHLISHHQPVMVLGAIWCPLEVVRKIYDDIRSIKRQHGLSRNFEVKWTKVSPGKLSFYRNLVDYFFDEPDIRFRALIIRDKAKLDHRSFGHDHDTWYFKMYFGMIKAIISPNDRYRIYLDIKDTRSADKILKLHRVLGNAVYDFDQSIIERVQTVRSHEVELLQLADFLMGAVRYANLDATKSNAKTQLVELIRGRSKYGLTTTTLLREEKFNLFFWRPKEAGIDV